MRNVLAAVVLVLLVACGEPPVDVAVPEREQGQHVLDNAGILDEARLEARLADVASGGPDIVALTYETEQASCGEAFRAAREFVRTWNADVAVVAVARPGDFTSDDQGRERCVGVQPLQDRAVPGSLRERIAEELVPPKASANDWDGAFEVAVDALVQQ